MKELSIEQKAKAYDEAIRRAKRMFSEKELKYLFPELKDSDYEIGKKLSALIEDIDDKTLNQYKLYKTELRVWLEKQGESDETKAKTFLINKGYPIDTNSVFPTYEEMYNIIREGFEKQGEQKPTSKVETKFKVKYAGSEYNVLEIKERIS